MGRAFSNHGRNKEHTRFLIKTRAGKTRFGRSGLNIKMNSEDAGWEGVVWIAVGCNG